jgi:hypothetical protein
MILAVCLMLPLQASPLDDFYKFKAGSTWTYKRLEDGAERKIIGKVIGEEGGSVRVDWKEHEKDGSLKSSSIITWSVKDDVLSAVAREEGGAAELSFSVLKAGSKKGDTWPSPGGSFVHQGKIEVTVPAGTYKDATWTQFTLGKEGNETKIDFYLVPRVGIVRIEIRSKDAAANRFELTGFVEAK